MSKPCQGRDEVLLMMAQGQLGLWKSLQIRWHVQRCPDCRGRLGRFSMLSTALATALASPNGPRWIPQTGNLRLFATKGLIVGVLVLFMIFGLLSLRRAAEASEQPKPETAPAAGPKHCGKSDSVIVPLAPKPCKTKA
ncbi:MAG: hypothetical protein H7Y17_17700 [Chlorobia bacterium]|nr:hypothetical protein [Fimbriimonadaceae bacterium]